MWLAPFLSGRGWRGMISREDSVCAKGRSTINSIKIKYCMYKKNLHKSLYRRILPNCPRSPSNKTVAHRVFGGLGGSSPFEATWLRLRRASDENSPSRQFRVKTLRHRGAAARGVRLRTSRNATLRRCDALGVRARGASSYATLRLSLSEQGESSLGASFLFYII